MKDLEIRPERENERRKVEELTREAFWNVYVPGCTEHFLLHKMRNHSDFIEELNLVAEMREDQKCGSDEEGFRIAGHIAFTRSCIVDGEGKRCETVTFGPLSVLPKKQRQGIGGTLIDAARKKAVELGYKAIVIFGDPTYYSRFGFQSAKTFGISTPDGLYPAAHQILELVPDVLAGRTGIFYESEVFHFEEEEAEAFDRDFPPKEKGSRDSQKRFVEISNTFL